MPMTLSAASRCLVICTLLQLHRFFAVPQPPPPTKPKPSPPSEHRQRDQVPYQLPAGAKASDVIGLSSVQESFVYSLAGQEYEKLGSTLSASNGAFVVGTASESTNAAVYLCTKAPQQQVSAQRNTTGSNVNKTSSSDTTTDKEESTMQWQLQKLTPGAFRGTGSTYYDGFGRAMAMSDTSLLVGAPYDSSLGYLSGVVYLFQINGTTNAEDDIEDEMFDSVSANSVTTLSPNYPTVGSKFGSAIALYNDNLIVGAPAASINGPQSGAAYSFAWNETNGEWEEESLLHDETNGAAYDQFGGVLSLYKSTLAISAVGASYKQVNAGAVYLYTKGFTDQDRSYGNVNTSTNAHWNLHSVLTPEDINAHAAFGHTLAFNEDVGLVSAYNAQGSGVVYVYELISTTSRATAINRLGRNLRSSSNEVKQFVNAWEMKTILLPVDSNNNLNMFGASLAIYRPDRQYYAEPIYADSEDALGEEQDQHQYEKVQRRVLLVSTMNSSDSTANNITQQAASNDSSFFNHHESSNATLQEFNSSSQLADEQEYKETINGTSASTNSSNDIAYSTEEGNHSSASTNSTGSYEPSYAIDDTVTAVYVAIVGAPGVSYISQSGSSDGVYDADMGGSVYLFANAATLAYANKSILVPAATEVNSTAHNVTDDIQWFLLARAYANETLDADGNQQEVEANNNDAVHAFGSTVAVMGRNLIVGAQLANTPQSTRAGAVYVETNLIPFYLTHLEAQEVQNKWYQSNSTASDGASSSSNDEDDYNNHEGAASGNESGNVDSGNGSDGAQSGTSDQQESTSSSSSSSRNQWTGFFQTTGGYITVAFVPVALIAVFFAWHFRRYKRIPGAQCCAANSYHSTGPRSPQYQHNRDGNNDSSLQQGQAPDVEERNHGDDTAKATVTPMHGTQSARGSSGTRGKSARLHYSNLTSDEDPERGQAAPQPKAADECAPRSSNSWLQSWKKNLFTGHHKPSAIRTLRTDDTSSSDEDVAIETKIGQSTRRNSRKESPSVPPVPSASPDANYLPSSKGKENEVVDMRVLRAAFPPDDENKTKSTKAGNQSQSFSVRSPLTHIPKQSLLVPSPNADGNARGADAVQSFRVHETMANTSSGTTAQAKGEQDGLQIVPLESGVPSRADHEKRRSSKRINEETIRI